MSDFPKLIHRSDAWFLAQMKVDYHKQLIEHERDNIAFANVRIHFGEPSGEQIAFANQIIERAENRINQLSFELRALELQLKEVEKNDCH